MLKKLKAVDGWLDQVAPILILLLIVVVLRIPNFFEPYWYGDEGIYLTIGNALKHGEGLYQDIIDHKTPIIYYLAMVPNQMWFRVLNLVWGGASVVLFFFLANRIIKNTKIVYLVSLIFTLLVTTPLLEGNIPNGELFVMGFVFMGGLLWVSHFIAEFVTDHDERIHHRGCELWFLTWLGKNSGKTGCAITYFIAGIFFGLAVLTKVPAIFDVAAMLSLAWFVLWDKINLKKFELGMVVKSWRPIFAKLGLVLVGVVTPILLSIVYYTVIGHGQAYLDFGLLYNFKYVQNWSLPFTDPTLVWLFSLPGKLTVAVSIILGLTLLGRRVSIRFKLAAAWLVLSLFGATLSNRPYPHYFLQVVPAAALVVGFMVEEIVKLLTASRPRKKTNPLDVVIGLLLLAMMVKVFILLQFGFYPTVGYYQRFYKYVTGEISREQYYLSFDSLMRDNYEAVQIIQQSDDPYLFIWGTNPTLYALSQKVPTGRFVVSFHVRDFDAYDETLQDFIDKKPMFAVTMDNEAAIPGLDDYLTTNYIPNSNFEHFVLWKRMGNE